MATPLSNIEVATLEFQNQYANSRRIDHDFKFKYIPLLEANGRYFMQKAFEAYGRGDDLTGNHCAKHAERHFVKAQLLKNFSTEKTPARANIAKQIAAFKGQ